MHEGALTLTADKTILYANSCFASMVKCRPEELTGGSLRRFLSPQDRATLRPLLKRRGVSRSQTSALLRADDGSQLPVLLSLRHLTGGGGRHACVSVVVTDASAPGRTERALRMLFKRLVQAQEAERGRVALDLHDHVTQLLCAILFRLQALTDRLSLPEGPARAEAAALHRMVASTVEEVERISRHLRPSVLEELGLVAVLRATGKEFALRTKVTVKLSCARLTSRLPAPIELALYRILQEALRNVDQHAHARRVTVRLSRHGDSVRLAIRDDGIGFDRGAGNSLGLLSMRERAAYVGGTLTVSSTPGNGTEVEARMPLPPRPITR